MIILFENGIWSGRDAAILETDIVAFCIPLCFAGVALACNTKRVCVDSHVRSIDGENSASTSLVVIVFECVLFSHML